MSSWEGTKNPDFFQGKNIFQKKTLNKKPPIVIGKNFTPPKTNMEPENELLEEKIPIKNHHF